jgi:hypothetical protein
VIVELEKDTSPIAQSFSRFGSLFFLRGYTKRANNNDIYIINRLYILGDFSTHYENSKSIQILGAKYIHTFQKKVTYTFILTMNGLGYILSNFFTKLFIHPGGNRLSSLKVSRIVSYVDK